MDKIILWADFFLSCQNYSHLKVKIKFSSKLNVIFCSEHFIMLCRVILIQHIIFFFFFLKILSYFMHILQDLQTRHQTEE